jgi:hypothetical protein
MQRINNGLFYSSMAKFRTSFSDSIRGIIVWLSFVYMPLSKTISIVSITISNLPLFESTKKETFYIYTTT